MQCLPSSIVINTRPGGHRPIIIQLPVQRPHTSAAMPPEMLHTALDRNTLQDLAHIQQLFKILGITEVFGEIIQDLSVSGCILLMALHNRRKDIEIFRFRKRTHRLDPRKRLKTELRQKAEIMIPESTDGFLLMPHFPIMGIPPVLTVRLVKTSSGRRR